MLNFLNSFNSFFCSGMIKNASEMQKVPFWTFSDPTTPGFSEWWKMLVLMAAGRGQLPDGCGSMLTASTTSSTRQHTQTLPKNILQKWRSLLSLF